MSALEAAIMPYAWQIIIGCFLTAVLAIVAGAAWIWLEDRGKYPHGSQIAPPELRERDGRVIAVRYYEDGYIGEEDVT